MSELSRLVGIFWDPKPVFADLAARPRWWVPLILGLVLGLAYLYMFSQIVGWERFFEQQNMASAQIREMPPEQQRQVLSQQVKFGVPVVYASAALAPVIACLICAAILLLLFKTFGGFDLTFKQSFSIIVYGGLPMALFQVLAMVAVNFTNPADFNLTNPLPFNAGWFFDPVATPAWLVTLMTSLDLFTLWVIALVALGYSVAARKLSYGTAFVSVFGGWLLWVVLKTGTTAIFS